MEPLSLAGEQWREYDFAGRVYRIESPRALYVGSTTHRVVGPDGAVHLLPAPGHAGCVVRWQPRNEHDPVQF